MQISPPANSDSCHIDDTDGFVRLTSGHPSAEVALPVRKRK